MKVKVICKLLVFILCFLIIASCIVFAFTAQPNKNVDFEPVVTLNDIYIPITMRKEGLGLFWVGRDNIMQKSTDGTDFYDKEKPVMIFFHGMQMAGCSDDEQFTLKPYTAVEDTTDINLCNYWIDKGYNVGLFYWSQLASDNPFNGQSKIWGVDGKAKMSWQKTRTKMEVVDMPSHSVAEIFVAYYLDFMNKYGCSGPEIRFTGLSLGAQMVYAVTSYLLTKVEQNLLPLYFIPDRLSIFDAYLCDLKDETYISWLKKPIGKNGSVELVAEIAAKAKERGIATDFIGSSLVSIASMLANGKEIYDKLLEKTAYLDYNSDWIPYIEQNNKHTVGMHWYNYSAGFDASLDYKMQVPSDYSISPSTPTSYIFARMGNKYSMSPNFTINPSDDRQTITNVNCAKVAGFVFNDVNNNGVNDDRIANRVKKAQVSLYLVSDTGDKFINSTTTDLSGAYSFDIEPTFSNGWGEFYIKVESLDGYTFTSRADKTLMMNNDINFNGKSDYFKFINKNHLVIINCGII